MSSLPADQGIGSPTLDQISGPLLLATTFNWALFGVLSVQVFMYAQAPFSSDSKFIKSIVYGVYLLEAIQSILIVYDAFHIFVLGFLNMESLLLVNTLWISLPILTGLVTFICQGLFAYRIWVLGKNRYFKVAFWVISLCGGIQLMASFTLAVILKNIENFELIITTGQTPMFALVTAVWVLSSAIVDVLVAVCTISLLSSMETDVAHTRNIVRRLVRLTAGTGSMTAAIAVVSAALMLALPQKSYYKTSLATLGKMYSNCMMVMSNSRIRLESGEMSERREKDQKQDLTDIEFAER